ncbi:EipB family protein, partial [Rhizobium ruizarguesonis]
CSRRLFANLGLAVEQLQLGELAGNAGAFSKTAFWPVTIAYFNENAKSDALPVYRMSFKLYENGITRDLTMDYGDFVLTGKLAKLELLDRK